MNVWTAFFLVVSIVILAAPLLLAGEVAKKRTRSAHTVDEGRTAVKDSELELDLAAGRLAREDYEEMRVRTQAAGPAADERGGLEGVRWDREDLP